MSELGRAVAVYLLTVLAIIGAWELAEQVVRGEFRRWWQRRPWSRWHDDVSTRAEVAKGYVPLQLASPFESIDDAFARMDDGFARMDEDFARLLDTAGGTCPACRRLRTLHAEFPHLTAAQLAAVLARQVALGRCAPHQVGEPRHD